MNGIINAVIQHDKENNSCKMKIVNSDYSTVLRYPMYNRVFLHSA